VKIIRAASCCIFLLAPALHAQQLLDRFTFDLGGGFGQTVLTTGQNLNSGWTVRGGAGYNFTPRLGALIEFGDDGFRVSNSALQSLGTPTGLPGGDVRVRSITIDPIWHLRPNRRWDFYLTGGAGIYRRRQQFTKPSVATATGYNPFFGFNTPGYPMSQEVLSSSTTKPGVNIGAGVSMNLKWRLKFFAEARYTHIFLGSRQNTDYVPITVGVRW
jgi:opacity protein-like surface antigen